MLKRIALAFLLGVPLTLAIGFLVGIIPGLLLGLLNWHQAAAIIIPIIWAIGYLRQRAKNYGDVNIISFCIAVLGGLGAGSSIWLFGGITGD